MPPQRVGAVVVLAQNSTTPVSLNPLNKLYKDRKYGFLADF